MRGKYGFGIILVLIGASFLLEELGIIYFGDIIRFYWPIILILLGLSGLFDRRSSKLGNLIVILVGITLQVNKFEVIDINVWGFFFPVLLILIGVNFIFSRKKNVANSGSVNIGTGSKKKSNITLDNTLDEFVILGRKSTNNRSQDFKGGKVTTVLGRAEVNLRGTSLNNKETYLDITTIMGGVEVLVPRGCRVEVKGTPILGRWSNKAKNNTDLGAPLLKIKCFVMFGGIEVK